MKYYFENIFKVFFSSVIEENFESDLITTYNTKYTLKRNSFSVLSQR